MSDMQTNVEPSEVPQSKAGSKFLVARYTDAALVPVYSIEIQCLLYKQICRWVFTVVINKCFFALDCINIFTQYVDKSCLFLVWCACLRHGMQLQSRTGGTFSNQVGTSCYGGRNLPSLIDIALKCGFLKNRYRPRFFDQVGHQTIYASIGNKHFFTKSCHHQTYQNFEKSRQKLGTFL